MHHWSVNTSAKYEYNIVISLPGNAGILLHKEQERLSVEPYDKDWEQR